MAGIGAYHPLIVHTPVALLIFSALFALAGVVFEREWLRRAATLLLVCGFLGAFAAVQSGQAAHRVPEHQQHVPEAAIDAHAFLGRLTLWIAGAALLCAAFAAFSKGPEARLFAGLALVLQLAAAVTVGMAGLRGGALVFEHGANVRVGGQLVRDTVPR